VATIIGTYGYSDSATPDSTSTSSDAPTSTASTDIGSDTNAVALAGTVDFLIEILVPLAILGCIVSYCCWYSARNRRNQGVVVVQNLPFAPMETPYTPGYNQDPGIVSPHDGAPPGYGQYQQQGFSPQRDYASQQRYTLVVHQGYAPAPNSGFIINNSMGVPYHEQHGFDDDGKKKKANQGSQQKIDNTRPLDPSDYQ
jgi:hypothetical protein